MNDIHSPTVVIQCKPAHDNTRRRSAATFNRLRRSKQFTTRDIDGAREEWAQLYGAVDRAKCLGGLARIPTGNRFGRNHSLRRTVLAAAVDAKVLTVQSRVGDNVRQRYSPGPRWK
jgi:hypothetical protein